MYPELWGWYAAAVAAVALFVGFNLWGWRRDPSYRWYKDGLLSVVILVLLWAILYPVLITSRARVERGRIVSDVVFSPDARWLASRNRAGRITLWNVASGRPERSFAAANRSWWPWVASATEIVARGRSLAFMPDGNTLAVARQPEGVRLYDAASGRHIRTLERGERPTLLDIAPDGSRMVTGSGGGGLTLWDTGRWAPVRRLPQPRPAVPLYDLAFTPGRLFLRTSERVEVWSVAPWKRLESHTASRGPARIVVSRNGRRMALAAEDPKRGEGFAVREVGRAGPIRTFWPERGNGAWFGLAALSPDGGALAVLGDEDVTLWDVATGERRRSFPTGGYRGWCLAFAPDGRALAAGFWDGTVRIWRL